MKGMNCQIGVVAVEGGWGLGAEVGGVFVRRLGGEGPGGATANAPLNQNIVGYDVDRALTAAQLPARY